MGYRYAYQGLSEGVARAVATDLSISTKTAVMLAQFLRGKPVARALRELREIQERRTAVPFTRFTEGAGHKPGIGPGKYPLKAAREFLRLLESVSANAQDIGLGEDLVLVGVTAQQGARRMRYGRFRGRQTKATHVEMIVAERDGAKTTRKAPAKKAASKPTSASAPVKKAAVKAPAQQAPAKTPARKAPAKRATKAPAKKASAKRATKKEPEVTA